MVINPKENQDNQEWQGKTGPGIYEVTGAAIGQLVDVKNKAYGRGFDFAGSILAILYPNGIRPEQYKDLGAMIRILDKFFRIATSKDALGESPWTDVAGYGLLMNRGYLPPAGEAIVRGQNDER